MNNVRILDAVVEFSLQQLAKPLQLSTGLITEATLASARVRVQVGAREAVGQGNIYLSDLWAWPQPALTHAERDAALREYSLYIADQLFALCGGELASPIELGLRLHHALERDYAKFSACGIDYEIPLLARAMCASPFDAALHDAVGLALECSAFNFYTDNYAIPSADEYFAEKSACSAIRKSITAPSKELDAWLIVGAKDNIEKDVAPWITQRGYRCFKLKVLGQDNAADAERTSEVFRAVKSLGAQSPRLCVDSNEANPNADSVLDYLERLRVCDAEAFAALEYLEQPTGRDITVHAFDWRKVTALKPVLLDEGLTSLRLLKTSKEQGWGGLAIKTCKGHSFALVAAAWARENHLMLTMQDLTNPGLSAIHSALFAAHIPMHNGIELNSPQYTPAANAGWLPRLSGLFEVKDGVHRLPASIPHGLGSQL